MPTITIVPLDKSDHKDWVTTFAYESEGHYRVKIDANEDGWTINLRKEKFPETFVKHDENDRVVTDYKGDSELYEALVDGAAAGKLQIEFQEYNKSVRVWDIDVWPKFKRMGVGKAMMELAIRRAREMGARRIVLETQSSNLPAIEFYKKMGFDLIGLDGTHYHNDDMERGEVRLEMALHL